MQNPLVLNLSSKPVVIQVLEMLSNGTACNYESSITKQYLYLSNKNIKLDQSITVLGLIRWYSLQCIMLVCDILVALATINDSCFFTQRWFNNTS